jgi:hypothetical protein
LDPYLWAAVTIWCFDQLARLVRWLYCNIHIIKKTLITTKASAADNEDANIIILQISSRSHRLKPSSRQHYFIYQYSVWLGWKNQPFSLASWK